MEDIHSLLIDAPAPTGLSCQLTSQSLKYTKTLGCVIVDEHIHSSITFLCLGFYSCNTEIMPGIYNWTSGVQVHFVEKYYILLIE